MTANQMAGCPDECPTQGEAGALSSRPDLHSNSICTGNNGTPETPTNGRPQQHAGKVAGSTEAHAIREEPKYKPLLWLVSAGAHGKSRCGKTLVKSSELTLQTLSQDKVRSENESKQDPKTSKEKVLKHREPEPGNLLIWCHVLECNIENEGR